MNDVLAELASVLEARKKANPEESYVANLHAKGLNKILEKVGEEATETLLAAKDLASQSQDGTQAADKSDLIYETADLWFHTLVMLSHLGLGPEDILKELARRFDLSGLEEKAARQKHPG